MEELEFRLLDNLEDVINLEKLRSLCFDNKEFIVNNVYYDNIINGKIVVVECFYKNKLVGAIYVSDSLNSLYIEQLFILKEYRNRLFGTNLMNYVIDNKEIFEKYFNKRFIFSRLESRNKDNFYNKVGYRQEHNIMGTMKKNI